MDDKERFNKLMEMLPEEEVKKALKQLSRGYLDRKRNMMLGKYRRYSNTIQSGFFGNKASNVLVRFNHSFEKMMSFLDENLIYKNQDMSVVCPQGHRFNFDNFEEYRDKYKDIFDRVQKKLDKLLKETSKDYDSMVWSVPSSLSEEKGAFLYKQSSSDFGFDPNTGDAAYKGKPIKKFKKGTLEFKLLKLLNSDRSFLFVMDKIAKTLYNKDFATTDVKKNITDIIDAIIAHFPKGTKRKDIFIAGGGYRLKK